MIYIKHASGNEEYAYKEDGKIKYIPIWTTKSIKAIQDDGLWKEETIIYMDSSSGLPMMIVLNNRRGYNKAHGWQIIG